MSFHEVLIDMMAVFALLGGLDRILGGRFGLGSRFEEGILSMGSLALAMVGIVSLAPVLAGILKPIVVPVYRAERYIEETMDCVRAQTYPHWELLLVEDCGPDRSREIIEQYIQRTGDTRIRMLTYSTNLGAARARNLGVNEAKGRYLAYLDADDLWTPDKLEKELAFLKEKQAAFVFTGYEFADENGKGTGKIVRVPATITYKEALKNTTIFTSTVMFDMEQLSKEQLQMPQIKSEDTALWWRILREGYVACGLDQNLVKYRRAGKSLSSNKLEALRRIWNLYRKAEGMSVPNSAWHFCFWAVRAVKRRV